MNIGDICIVRANPDPWRLCHVRVVALESDFKNEIELFPRYWIKGPLHGKSVAACKIMRGKVPKPQFLKTAVRYFALKQLDRRKYQV